MKQNKMMQKIALTNNCPNNSSGLSGLKKINQ